MNTKTTHTPGPWRIGVPDENGWGIYKNSGGYAIAVVPIVYDYPQIANARLIAAAPELLEACKLLVAYAEDVEDEYSSGAFLLPNRMDIDNAKAAIRKAEGSAAIGNRSDDLGKQEE